MEPLTNAWETDYSKRGLLWGGITHDLPELPVGSRVLELGCGNGKTLSAMIQRGWDVTAIDFSPRAVSFSRERFKNTSSCEFIVADVRHSPFNINLFDGIFAIHMFGHLQKPDRELIPSALVKTLKPGGILFFSDFSTDDFRCGSGDETEALTFRRGPGIITHYFSQKEVMDLFSSLTLLSIKVHQWPMRVRGKNLVRSEIKGIFSK
jgi:2-polyprenyl-3-methyl-5-hydroxy-6-metoxy-1,4-benzoquinol methylase